MIGHWWIYRMTFPVKKLYSEFWWWCSSLCPRYQDFSLLPLVTRSAGSDCCSIGPGIRKLLILLKTSPKSHESVNPKLRRLSYCDSPFLMGFVSEKKSQWWLPVSTWYPGLNDLCWRDPIPLSYDILQALEHFQGYLPFFSFMTSSHGLNCNGCSIDPWLGMKSVKDSSPVARMNKLLYMTYILSHFQDALERFLDKLQRCSHPRACILDSAFCALPTVSKTPSSHDNNVPYKNTGDLV